jgi:RNA polymerase sigma-70 factor (ECF subfamily)
VKRARARITTALSESSADLLAYLQRRVGADEAPDLLGETMVVAWRRVDELPNDPEQARMWLFGIARATLLNHSRGERRRWALADRIRNDQATRTVAPAWRSAAMKLPAWVAKAGARSATRSLLGKRASFA